jgi:hypothetical protein
MYRNGDFIADLNALLIEEEAADLAESLTVLRDRLSSQPADYCVPHFSEIICKIATTTFALRQGRSVTLLSPEDFRRMFQGFLVPVDKMKYKNRTVKRMMDRFHRNTILALNTGEDPACEGSKLWDTLQAQYFSILRRLEARWRSLGLLSPMEAARRAREASISVQLTIASRKDAVTVCTVRTEHGQVSFQLDSAAGSEVLSTFLRDPEELAVVQESLGALLRPTQEGQEEGGGSFMSGTGTEYSLNDMVDADSYFDEGACAQRRKSV